MRGEKIRPQPKPTGKPPRRPPKKAGALTRAECAAFIYARAAGRCERCRMPVSRTVWEGHPQRAHVNERLPRSRGGDPCDPHNCELVCQGCHQFCGGHAPTIERQERLLDGKGFLGEGR